MKPCLAFLSLVLVVSCSSTPTGPESAATSRSVGVAVFTFSRDPSKPDGEYSPVWTARAVTHLDLDKVSSTPVSFREHLHVGQDMDASTIPLLAEETARTVDFLICGAVTAGDKTRIVLRAGDTRSAAIVGRAEVEDVDAEAALSRALDEVLAQVERHRDQRGN